MRALEFGQKAAILRVFGDVKAIAVAVTDENVALRRDVDAVGKVDGGVGANLLDEFATPIVSTHAVALEVANVEGVVGHGHVRRLLHVLRAGKPKVHRAKLIQHQTGRIDRIHNHNLPIKKKSFHGIFHGRKKISKKKFRKKKSKFFHFLNSKIFLKN